MLFKSMQVRCLGWPQCTKEERYIIPFHHSVVPPHELFGRLSWVKEVSAGFFGCVAPEWLRYVLSRKEELEKLADAEDKVLRWLVGHQD